MPVRPEVERRAKDTTVTQHVVETLIGKQSRKVAFGIWGFMIGNGFLASSKISNHQWLIWSCLMAVLIGFGTIADDVLSKFGDKLAGAAATRVDTLVETTVVAKTTEQTVEQTPPVQP